MRNSVDITRPYQFGYMLLRHIMGVLIVGVIELIAFLWIFDKPIIGQIIAAVFVLVYGGYLYAGSRRLAIWDKKSYTPLKPSVKWGVLWGVMITLTIAVIVALYYVNWICFSETITTVTEQGTEQVGVGFKSIGSVIVNVLVYIWLSPYFGFVNMPYGFPVYAIALMLITPVVSTTLGYISALKNFDIVEKLDSMTFEKDDEQ